MLKTNTPYTEDELSMLLSQAGDLYRKLEDAVKAARNAARTGDQPRAGLCVRKANELINRIGNLGAPETVRAGRPRAIVQENADRPLGQIRNSMRLGGPAATLARELGISESTFRRRMRKTTYLPDHVLFSHIP